MPKSGEMFLAGAGDHAAVVGEHDVLAPGQRIGQRHAETAGDMVVAGARRAQLIVAVPARPITLRSVGRDDHDALDHARDLAASRAGSSNAGPCLVSESKVRLPQLGEMLARRLRRHAGDVSKLARRQRASVDQRHQNVGARRIADQRGNFGDGGMSSGMANT